MSEITSKNKTLMQRIYHEMWNNVKPSLAAELFSQPEGVQQFVSQFLLSFADLQHTVEEMLTEGDRVVVRFSAKGTHTGQWMHFEPTNKSIHYTGVTLARIVGDRIIEHHTWWDKAGLIEQIERGQPMAYRHIQSKEAVTVALESVLIIKFHRLTTSTYDECWQYKPLIH